MTRTTLRRLAATAGAVAAVVLGIGGLSTANAEVPGTPCGPNMVITTINTCETINSSCTGYDMMLIGRVDSEGRCVVPGMNGTTW